MNEKFRHFPSYFFFLNTRTFAFAPDASVASPYSSVQDCMALKCVCLCLSFNYPYDPCIWWMSVIMKPTECLSQVDQTELPTPHIWAFVPLGVTETSFSPSLPSSLTGQVGG